MVPLCISEDPVGLPLLSRKGGGAGGGKLTVWKWPARTPVAASTVTSPAGTTPTMLSMEDPVVKAAVQALVREELSTQSAPHLMLFLQLRSQRK